MLKAENSSLVEASDEFRSLTKTLNLTELAEELKLESTTAADILRRRIIDLASKMSQWI
jgi:hypothetical protein